MDCDFYTYSLCPVCNTYDPNPRFIGCYQPLYECMECKKRKNSLKEVKNYDDEGLKMKKIDGVGKDAETITSENGGKQSKSPAALYLVDPVYLFDYFLPSTSREKSLVDDPYRTAGREIVRCLEERENRFKANNYLTIAMGHIEPDKTKRLFAIGKVLQEGAEKYEPNNWRLIPREQHINHALIHLAALIEGDTQDDHKDHCLCRLMMALATKESEGFSYTEYIKKGDKY